MAIAAVEPAKFLRKFLRPKPPVFFIRQDELCVNVKELNPNEIKAKLSPQGFKYFKMQANKLGFEYVNFKGLKKEKQHAL